MDSSALLWIALLMAVAAALYSSVGHGGASAYLAIMALFAVAPETMRPTALALNLVVAGFGTARYALAGKTNWRLLAAFVVTAAPAAFVGGWVSIPPDLYRPLVGLLLWLAALRLFWQPKSLAERPVRMPPLAVALPAGAGLGLLAGLTGTGGGIFLSPLIILFHWEEPRRTSGVAAAFIFINSAAGLAGNVAAVQALPSELPVLAAAVAGGALLGTWLGVDRLPRDRLLQALGLVLAIAGFKLIFT
ncbi:sulfite exporter TauE/SafE family protein [Sphingosinicella terrae]|uniref:sulfite exporter TauE/SafE family protein n=1 Tax=Sphingosinicella terrae TaxID=2172047 RepID=UPI000E0DAA01|nr:sulfite exporter TauE/SafE family protein [Sphingosinicella terrae]